GRAVSPRPVGGGPRREPVRAIPSHPPCPAGHEATWLGTHHQHGLNLFDTRGRESHRHVTTKTAILGMTRAVAIETATTGITCNALCPGTLPTPAIESRIAALAENDNLSIDEATSDYLASRQPSRRFVSMKNVGATVAFLCSPAA